MWFAVRVIPGIGDAFFVADRMRMVYRTAWSRENEYHRHYVGGGFVEWCRNR